jgi:hypothetical protein
MGGAWKTAEQMLSSDSQNAKDVVKLLSAIYEGTAVATGLPLTVTERARKAIESEVPLQTLLIGGEWNGRE